MAGRDGNIWGNVGDEDRDEDLSLRDRERVDVKVRVRITARHPLAHSM